MTNYNNTELFIRRANRLLTLYECGLMLEREAERKREKEKV